MKKYIYTILLAVAILPTIVYAGIFDFIKTPIFGDGNVYLKDQWTSTTSPSSAITQTTFGKTIRITGLSDGCLGLTSGILGSSGLACGTGGGGGSSGGTWSTTTSSVLNQFINYSNNTTDIPTIGATATTTAKYWFDPNTQTAYLSGNVGIGSSSPSSTLSVTGNLYQRGGYTHFGTADSGFACRTISTSCIELIGDDNTDGGVIFQIENRNAGTNAFSGLNLLNNEASRGNNASFYSGLFLNSSGYSNSVFGNLNNVPRILQLGNTMGPITIQSSSTDLTAPYINLALNNLEIARITPFGLGVGTTSARFPVQIAATTTSQLVLTSNGITESNWGFRNAGGYQYIVPINPVTFATSTNPSITMSPTLNQVAIGTSTLAAGVQLTIGAGANPVAVLYDSISATGMYTIYRNSNIDFGYIGSAGVLFSGSGGSKTDLAIRASQNLTFGSGSGEDMRIATNGFVGIATSSPMAPLSVVGFGGIVTPNITATSTTATSTFAGGVDLRNATVQQKGDFVIPFATSTATTTRQFYNVTTLETWTSAACKTASGTANIVFSDGTNSTNMIPASSTYATYNFTQNNRFVPGMTVQYSVGTPVSLTDVFCTVNYISNI